MKSLVAVISVAVVLLLAGACGDDPGFDRSPAWSPDGSRIAFESFRDRNHEIYVMNADGSDVIQLTDNRGFDRSPAWSPDGSRIAFDSDRDGNDEIYVMNADGSGQTNLTKLQR